MHVTGLILAGGRGTRMGGVDKGLQLLDAKPMVEHVLQRLRPQVQHLLINANQNPDRYEAYGAPVWPDSTPDFAGPLAGLQSGLAHCETPYLVCVPCDAPFFPLDLVSRLAEPIHNGEADLTYAVTDQGSKRQAHPVFCLLSTHVRTDLDQFLGDGGRKMGAWFTHLRATAVLFPNDANFRNINTLDELQRSCMPLAADLHSVRR